MNLKKNKIFIILFFCLTMLLTLSLKVNAANADIKVEPSTVELGESVKITVSGKGVQWNLKLKVDGEVLKTDSELENYEANKNISFSATYTPKTVGTKKVTLEGSVTEFSDGSTIKSFESKSITVKEKPSTTDKNTTTNNNTTTNTTTNTNTNTNTSTTTTKPKEKSNNAYLKTLGVRIKDSLAKELGVATNKYDFSGFSKTKTSYDVTVPKNVDSLKVVATPADSNAKVKITGNSGFEVGTNNKITIKVTAEDGKTTKTYTIKVTQLAEEEEKPGNIIEEIEEIYLTSLELEGIEISPKFDKDTYSYTAKLDNVDATEVKVNAKSNIENANIEISGNTELVEGENTINVLVTLDDSEEQKIYQIVIDKAEKVIAAVTDVENNNPKNNGTLTDLMGNFKKYIVIAIAVVLFIIIAVIVLIILLRRESKKTIEDEENTEEYNVYQNDINEFENKTSEADNFIESLYRQRNGNLYNEEALDEEDKQTLEEINRETDKIFADKVEGQSVEYTVDEIVEERKPRRRSKGKHSK